VIERAADRLRATSLVDIIGPVTGGVGRWSPPNPSLN